MKSAILHQIAHRFGWNTGRIVSWTVDGKVHIAWVCSGCGLLYEVPPLPRVHI